MKISIVLIALFVVIVTADDYNSNANEDPDYYMVNNEEAAGELVEYYSENSDRGQQDEVETNGYHEENNDQNSQYVDNVEYNSEDNDQTLSAEPEPQPEPAERHSANKDKILKQDTFVNNKGFKYNFETSNGIYTDGSGMLKDFGKGFRDISKGLRRDNGLYHGKNYRHDQVHKAVVAEGAFGWVDKKTGAKFDIKYVADERGYQPAPIRLPKH